MAAPVRKRKLGKASASSSSNDPNSRDWARFDELLGGKILMSADARVRCNTASERERANVKLLRHKLKVQDRDAMIKISPDTQRSLEELAEIGQTLEEAFELDKLNLENKVDIAVFSLDHVTHAPGVTEEQLSDWEKRIRLNMPPSLDRVSMSKLHKLLLLDLTEHDEIMIDEAEQPHFKQDCWLALMWFVHVAWDMPQKYELKNMHMKDLLEQARRQDNPRALWKEACKIYGEMQQDVVDFIDWTQKQEEQAILREELVQELKIEKHGDGDFDTRQFEDNTREA